MGLLAGCAEDGCWCRLDIEAWGILFPGPSGVPLGLRVWLGDCLGGGSWLEEVLVRCMEPEDRCEGPKDVLEVWGCCWLGAWGWPEELARD